MRAAGRHRKAAKVGLDNIWKAFLSVVMCITVYPNKMMFQKTLSNKILPANFTTTVANINKITPQGKKFQIMGTGQARGPRISEPIRTSYVSPTCLGTPLQTS